MVLRRRDALATLLSAIPLAGRPNTVPIRDVEIVRVEGRREAVAGVDRQHQVQPNHVYDDLRPKPYRDNPNPTRSTANASALYLRIVGDSGLYGLYGPVDTEAALWWPSNCARSSPARTRWPAKRSGISSTG